MTETTERDINDLFDEITLTEERFAQKGYDEGFAEGCNQGQREGYQLGYTQGVLLGQELGEIYGAVVAAQQHQRHTDKVQRTLQQLHDAIEAFPRQNDPDADIIGAVEHIRTLNKRVRVMLGQKATTTTTDSNKAVHKDLSF